MWHTPDVFWTVEFEAKLRGLLVYKHDTRAHRHAGALHVQHDAISHFESSGHPDQATMEVYSDGFPGVPKFFSLNFDEHVSSNARAAAGRGDLGWDWNYHFVPRAAAVLEAAIQ